MICERFCENIGPLTIRQKFLGQSLYLFRHVLRNSDADHPGLRIMLSLGQQIADDQLSICTFVSENNQLGGTSKRVDANTAKDLPLAGTTVAASVKFFTTTNAP